MALPLQVVAAIIVNEAEEILLCQRGSGKHLAGKWEFPGGKVEPGESLTEALIREIREELELTTIPKKVLNPVDYDYGNCPLQLTPIICEIEDSENAAPCLHEHSAYQWCQLDEIKTLDLAAADILLLRRYKKQCDYSSGF